MFEIPYHAKSVKVYVFDLRASEYRRKLMKPLCGITKEACKCYKLTTYLSALLDTEAN